MAARDDGDWAKLREALCKEQPAAEADRILDRLRDARKALPASHGENVPPLWFDDRGGMVELAIDGAPGVTVRDNVADAVRELIDALVAERNRAPDDD